MSTVFAAGGMSILLGFLCSVDEGDSLTGALAGEALLGEADADSTELTTSFFSGSAIWRERAFGEPKLISLCFDSVGATSSSRSLNDFASLPLIAEGLGVVPRGPIGRSGTAGKTVAEATR